MYRAHDRHGPIVDGHVYDLKNPRRTGAPQPRHNPFHQAGRINSQPTTMETLQGRTGEYFGRAKTHVEWSAISAWMMKGQATAAIEAAGIPYEVARVAVRLVQQAKDYAKGWPRLNGPNETPLLHGLSNASQNEAGRTANEVFRVWIAEGRPCLSAKRIEDTYQFLVAAVRQGKLPPIRAIPADEPQTFMREPTCLANNLKF